MCGLTGIWRYGDAVTQDDMRDLGAMTEAIAHRGPDGEGSWNGGVVALGHRRLSILDRSSHAAQPMHTADGTGVLAYNGEVYNFREMRGELERAGVVCESTGDTEVVLQALHVWGPEAAIPRFDGMFALAYYDARSRTLWLARDRLGIKPLSLSRRNGRLLFASEDKALLAAADARAEIDTRILMLRFLHLKNANDTSLIAGVERLKPGTMLRLEGAKADEIVYWDPLGAFDAQRLAADRGGEREKLDALRGLFEDSVRRHLVADTPLATCLSGGVDSGLITAVAARERGGIDSYVADPDREPNEPAAAGLTAARVGARLRRVPIGREEMLRNWPAAVFAMETSSRHFSDIALLTIARRCRSDGIPILLTGEGSDELFGGYATYERAAKRWRAADAPWVWFRKRASRERLLSRLENAPFTMSLAQVGTLSRPLHLEAAAPLSSLLQSECVRAVSDLPSARDRGIVASGLHDLMSHLQELLNRHDRLAMAASVEMRVPFIENGLIDFGMHLPARFLLRRRTPKYLLKKLAEDYLPHQNIYKSKLGFPMSSAHSAGTQDLLRGGRLGDVMRWSRREADAAWQHAASDPGARLHLVGAEIYARLFVDGQAPQQVGEDLLASAEDAPR